MNVQSLNVLCNDDLLQLKQSCIRYRNNLINYNELNSIYNKFLKTELDEDLEWDIHTQWGRQGLQTRLVTLCKIIDKILYEKCQHEWTTDWIDTSYDTAKKIIYCPLCEITLKNII